MIPLKIRPSVQAFLEYEGRHLRRAQLSVHETPPSELAHLVGRIVKSLTTTPTEEGLEQHRLNTLAAVGLCAIIRYEQSAGRVEA